MPKTQDPRPKTRIMTVNISSADRQSSASYDLGLPQEDP